MPSGPLVVPSLHSGHYSLGAFGPLNPIETLELASNYYLEVQIILIIDKKWCRFQLCHQFPSGSRCGNVPNGLVHQELDHHSYITTIAVTNIRK